MQTLFYFHEADLYPYRPINSIWMLIIVLLSFILFISIDRITKSLNHEVKFNWLRQNTLLSFIHSCICSILIIIAVLRAPEMFDDPLSHTNFFNYSLIAFSIGYFCYDFLDCLQNSTSSTVAIIMHHVIVISFLSHVLLRTRNIGYALYALSLEINSVFLHARRLLRWYTPVSNQNLAKTFIDIGNYITFIIFRFGIVIVGLHAAYIQQHRLGQIIYLFTIVCVASIGILNVVLFYRLVNNQIRGKTQRKKLRPDEDQILTTDNHVLLPS